MHEDVELIDRNLAWAITRCVEPTQLDDPDDLALLFLDAGRAAQTGRRGRTGALIWVARVCADWLRSFSGLSTADIKNGVRRQFTLAWHKYDGRTPYSDQLTDQTRESLLLEGVGDVARSCSPDPDTGTWHCGALIEALTGVVATAAAWTAHLSKPQEAS